MPKSVFILMLIFGLMISSALALDVPPQDYAIVYVFKNADGTVSNMIKYYMRDGNKFRTEYITTVEYSMTTNTEASADLNDDTSSNVSTTTQLNAKQISNPEPHTVEILRNDKKLVWSLDPSYKNYIEVPLKQESWEHILTNIFISDFQDFKKTGEAELLSYTCVTYESVQKVKEDTWTNIAYVSHDLGVIMKTELWQNGNLVQIMEATEFNLEKPAKSLFEIPGTYTKYESNE
jgi:hypothetical protein